MAIPDEDVAQVRAAIDLSVLAGEYTALKRVGRRYTGLCPFHSEKTPSFSVNAEDGLYYCFGCQAAGDAISFVRAMEGLDFVEAVERLAARAGIAVRNDVTASAREGRDRRQRLVDAMASAVAFYHERLLSAGDGGAARQYLRARGYDGEVVRRFRLGWAPGGFDGLVRALALPETVLRQTGLAYVNSRGALQDGFRERVIFPIFDASGAPIALGGRILPGGGRDGEAGPKYRNSPETAIYSKRRTLYGLNWAKQAMVQSGSAVICEGYTDVIGCSLAGVVNSVATCGTALTEDHFRLLGRFSKRLVMAFDADAAGLAAAARIYEWEKRHEVEVSVAGLPSGSDPSALAQADPDALRGAIEEARPFLSFRIEQTFLRNDLGAPEGRVRAAEEALAAIAEHPGDLVRDQYLVAVADRCRMDLNELRPRLEALRAVAAAPAAPAGSAGSPAGADNRGGRAHARDDGGAGAASGQAARAGGTGRTPVSPAGATGARAGAGGRAGRDALLLAIHRPAEVAAHLTEELFDEGIQRSAYRSLVEATNLHEAIERADPDCADLLSRLAVIEPDVDTVGAVAALVRSAAERALRELELEARAAGAADDSERLAAASRAIAWLKPELEALRAVEGGFETTDPLVAWLARREMQGA